MRNIVLENDLLKVMFDPKNGAILSLENKHTGWRIQGREELGLSFRMTIPITDRNNNPILGEKQILKSCEESSDGKQVTFIWDNLQPEFGSMVEVVFKSIVTLGDKGLSFKAEVTNNSPFIIEDINYPCIGDLKSPSADDIFSRTEIMRLS